MYGHVRTFEGVADHLHNRRPFGDVSRNNGHTQQFTLGLLQEVRQGQRIVDVASWVGVQQDRDAREAAQGFTVSVLVLVAPWAVAEIVATTVAPTGVVFATNV